MQSITPQAYWNQVFNRIQGKEFENASSWLRRYQPYLNEIHGKPVLEIGCGSGSDTRVLVEDGYQVTATDFSQAALALVRDKLPEATLVLHDTRYPFPFADKSFDAVISSLSLHYFKKDSMTRIIGEIGRMLQPGGLFFVRLNSVNDTEAPKQHPIERYYYSLESCRELFTDWNERSLQEVIEDYHGKPKVIIEGMFEQVR
ncbi:class I SAM-dependent methyltransferase [Paenibacillus sp. URB8-2]|uniref:class I SAM-dependent methyltransferase n=1 Tax=Paenibacillus sp. URB8-2 TaxID=2741301 RepID=UPI0015BF6F53|nr:class I SAM-dependent methyltransferase [Paenibacillus sp. URB8-2]BCG57371.1 hypothetical protein PUR_07960 [Paenibacillus sp. URB8-2]